MRHGRVNTHKNAMLELVLLFTIITTCCAAPDVLRDAQLADSKAPSRLLVATATPNSSTDQAHAGGLSYIYRPISKACDPACLEQGNCNAEEGRCECPWGYGGPACRTALLPACQPGDAHPPSWGFDVPRSCECVKQARKFFGCSETDDTCAMEPFHFKRVVCYRFKDRQPTEQYSLMPYENDTNVEWLYGFVGRGMKDMAVIPGAEAVRKDDLWRTRVPRVPLEECGAHNCSYHGHCFRRGPPAGMRCVCNKGYEGEDCSKPTPNLCLNNCRGRGTCVRGFCHCRPPYFGLDCGRERAWQLAPGAQHVPNRVRLKIYVYELPSDIAFPVAWDDGVTGADPTYLTFQTFLSMLLLDDAVRTENPWEANLFYVPTQAFWYSSNTNTPQRQIALALSYVAQTYPWFNMSRGRDHFVWTTGDKGSCMLPYELQKDVIVVTQFGLHASLRDNRTTFLVPHPLNPDHGCYNPLKDVLAAPWPGLQNINLKAKQLYEEVVRQGGAVPQRDILIFFAGAIRFGQTAYSNGVRQAVALYLKQYLAERAGGKQGSGVVTGDANETTVDVKNVDPNAFSADSDVLFVEGRLTRSYGELQMRSKFCLAPHGSGFGMRLTIAITFGCIPVIIQDHVYQPYESDYLPYHEFSLRLSKADIPHLVPILRSVSEADLRRLRLGMAKYYGAFLWDPAQGGEAYNYTIAALRRRLHGVWGSLWHN